MNVAFHFDVSKIREDNPGSPYSIPILDKIFRSLLSVANLGSVHLKIFDGDLLVYNHLHDKGEEEIKDILNGLMGSHFRSWKDIDKEKLRNAIFSSNIYVLLIEGLSVHVRDYLLSVLKKEASYLGAIEVFGANNIQWVFYNQNLPPKYRYFNRELHIFYTMGNEEDRDDGLEMLWQELPFNVVQWEDLQARHTVFDAYESFNHSVLLVRLSEILSGRLTHLADEVLLRIGDLNPELQKILYTAYKSFYSVQTSEEIAHASLSCRRFLVCLADILYPPRSEMVNGKIVDQDKYRNRLWAYIDEKFDVSKTVRDLVKTGIKDISDRIDKIDALANKGLHGKISVLELDRLLIALITVTYDLLSLTPPPVELPIEPHMTEIIKFVDGLNNDI